MWGFEIVVMLAMIAVNSVFAGYEIALASVTLHRLQRLDAEKRRGARVAVHMKKNMEASLAVVQLGITLVGAIAAAVGGAGAEENLAPALMTSLGVTENVAEVLAVALVVLPLTVITIVVGELIPKVFALRNPEWVCLTLSPFMRWFSFSVWPAVWCFENIVTGIMSWGERRMGSRRKAGRETAELQELRASAAVARATRLIGHREEKIIVGATEMSSRPVRDIMLPAAQINTLEANASLTDSLIAANRDMHTRFPVVDQRGDLQTVVGYVNVKDIIAATRLDAEGASLRAIVRSIPFLRDEQPVAESLERLMREHTQIALVRDGAGQVVGMITLEDILEELVGEIEDEYDRPLAHLVATGTSWTVGGGVTLRRLREVTGFELPVDSVPNGEIAVGAWIEARLGREARAGDVIETESVRLTVRRVRRKRVQEAQVSQRGQGEAPDLEVKGGSVAVKD